MNLVRLRGRLLLLALLLGQSACALGHLGTHALGRRLPALPSSGELALPVLEAPVEARQTPDGVWHLAATSERDAMVALGWLQARDRAFQLDLLRHLSQGRIAELLGDRMMGERSTLELDVQNRFLDFDAAADALWAKAGTEERALLEAFSAGVSAWLTTARLPLEHRLLGIDRIEAWTPHDTGTVFAFIMHGLASNANREVRRLLLACEAGVDGMERIWPTVIDPEVATLPKEAWPTRTWPVPPAVPDELARRLPALCPEPVGDAVADLAVAPAVVALTQGREASNNWVIAGAHTPSGLPLISNDPHLPYMNPPIVWAFEVSTPAGRRAGFTLPGLHRHVFGHNGRVAWGQTTHHMDRQDLYVLDVDPGAAAGATGYTFDGRWTPFERRTETFRIRGAEPVTRSVRFTRHGPVLQDLEWALAGRIPLVALRTTGVGEAFDLSAAAAMAAATRVTDFAAAITGIDGDCSNWVIADVEGHIGYRTPCRLPVRRAHLGTFPAPGWASDYEWQGFVAKAALPRLDNPERGWLASANTRVLPIDRFEVPLSGDPAPPERLRRISAAIEADLATGGHGVAEATRLLTDVTVGRWPAAREMLAPVCADVDSATAAERALLCGWNGRADAASRAAGLYVLWTNAVLDLGLADELPGGPGGWTWHYVQNFLQFETNVHRLFYEPSTAPVWDDVRTSAVETRDDIARAAFALAVADARVRWGADADDWAWGEDRPFVVRHPFSNGEGLISALFDADPQPGSGGAETVWKAHVPRADRAHLHVTVGPVMRLVVDLADPWSADYALAGGQSGWPGTRHYADRLDDWQAGHLRPLTPPPSSDDRLLRLIPTP